jgi:serine/threonine protein kinase
MNMICAHCGIRNAEAARFCANCGAGLTSASLASGCATPDKIARIQIHHPESPLGSIDRGETTQQRAPENGQLVTAADSVPDPLLNSTIAAKYRIDAKLGAGGMGAVYRATRLMIGDQVATKIVRANEDDPNAAERFHREAQSAALLNHPNAVNIYDFGVTDDGLQYLVMELVEGESLRQIIKEQGPISLSVATEITSQVCAALDEAHRQNIIHRDIKPDNIIVHSLVSGLRVKVLDFGIAKLRDRAASHLTQTGSVVGTPHYMSPEQCLGEELDGRADIYSMGIVLYEMLCGRVPFNAPVSTAVVVQHVNQPPPSLRMINPSISPQVEGVVLQALEKRRDLRPPTAGTLAQGLIAAAQQTSLTIPFSYVNEDTVVRGDFRTPTSDQMPATVHLRAAQANDAIPKVRSAVPGGILGVAQSHSKVLFAIAAMAVVGTAVGWGLNRSGRSAQPQRDTSQGDTPVSSSVTPSTAMPPNAPATLRSFEFVTVTLDSSGNLRSRDHKSAYAFPEDLGNGSKLEMVAVPPGEFMMGSPESEAERSTNEGPQHRVRLGYWFYMGKFEVTQAQWRAVMGTDPSYFKGCDECPVEQVSWDDAALFCRNLAARSGRDYRLPSEAEWEYAARAGSTMAFAFGDTVTMAAHGWLVASKGIRCCAAVLGTTALPTHVPRSVAGIHLAIASTAASGFELWRYRGLIDFHASLSQLWLFAEPVNGARPVKYHGLTGTNRCSTDLVFLAQA